GGMATVYLAQDLKHDRKVAIKVLRPELAAVIGVERFLREIQTIAALQHPHILGLIDSGTVEVEGQGSRVKTNPSTLDPGPSTFVYYVMPFIDGQSLRDRLNREKQLPINDAIRIATEVAGALDYAHRHGVIHRDIKPENIMLHDGSALVADFGIALAVSSAGGLSRMTETGMSLGTPHYMSPEQAMGEREITARSDVYALGAVTYEMLAGEPPFTGPTAQAILAKVVTSEPAGLIAQRKSVPPAVEDAVLTALQKLPADRFATTAEFAATLGGNEIAHPPHGTARGRGAGFPWGRAALGALAVVAAVAAWGWLRRPSPAPAPAIITYLPPPSGVDFGGGPRFAALSPDGSRLAFVGFSQDGGSLLWVWNLTTRQATPLGGTGGAQWPFWAPDGTALGYFAAGWLFRIPSQGGGPNRLCRSNAARGAAWSVSGEIVFVDTRGLIRTQASGGACIPIASGDSLRPWNRPSALPDGHHFIFSGIEAEVSGFQLVLLDSRTGTLRRLGPGGQPTFVPPDYLLYESFRSNTASLLARRFDPRRGVFLGQPVLVADTVWEPGGDLSYTASANGLLVFRPGLPDLFDILVDRSSKSLRADTLHQVETWTHAWARDHDWIAMGGTSLWLVDLTRRSISSLSPGSAGSGLQMSPAWSPHDTAVAYSAGCGISTRRLADGQVRQVLPSPMHAIFDARCNEPSDWSPDGRDLLVTVRAADSLGRTQIWRYSFADSSFAPLIAGAGNSMHGVLSPDGRWLAYASDITDNYEIYVAPYHGGTRGRRVSEHGGTRPRWRRDGRELFFYAPDYHIMSAPVQPGNELTVGRPVPVYRMPVSRADLELAVPYDASPDGQRFVLHPSSTTPDAPLVMMLNWPRLSGLVPQ
ncbi:MAG: protein kinase, partial [Gemmatimonadota bacterium]